MNAENRFEEIGIIIPAIPETSGSEEEIDHEINKLNEKLKVEFEKMINYCITVCNISRTEISKYELDFLAKKHYTKNELITDEDRWNELQVKWLQLNKKYFELQSKLAHTGCDEYDMNYMMQSELYKFFHEDMDKRRERLESPILRKIEHVNAEIAGIDAEQARLTSYTITGNINDTKELLQEIFILLLSEKE